MIFILTHSSSKSLNIEYRFFPETITTKLGIESISLNPITATNVKRTLKTIVATMQSSSEGVRCVEDHVIDSIVAQSQGDIRNAVNNLQLVSQQGKLSYTLTTATKQNAKTGKVRKVAQTKIEKGIGRDEQLDIFHGVGRALYPKWQNNKLVHSPEDLSDIFSSQPNNYIELVHSNYIKRFGNLEDICEASNVLSTVDVLRSEYRENDNLELMALNLATRGMMVYNSNMNSGFQPISSYANKKFKPKEEKYLHTYETYINKLGNAHTSKKNFFCDYVSIIKNIE